MKHLRVDTPPEPAGPRIVCGICRAPIHVKTRHCQCDDAAKLSGHVRTLEARVAHWRLEREESKLEACIRVAEARMADEACCGK